MSLFARPSPISLRPAEAILWSGVPRWRTLATRVFRIQAVGFYLSVLIFANALAARMQHLSLAQTLTGLTPVLIFAALALAGVALLAWSTGRTTRYTLTNQRVILQYGVAMAATLALPIRLVASVSVSDDAVADIAVALKPGDRVAFVKLWPHVRPWRFRSPQPMLRAVPDAGHAAALIAQTVADVQQREEALRRQHPALQMAA